MTLGEEEKGGVREFSFSAEMEGIIGTFLLTEEAVPLPQP